MWIKEDTNKKAIEMSHLLNKWRFLLVLLLLYLLLLLFMLLYNTALVLDTILSSD